MRATSTWIAFALAVVGVRRIVHACDDAKAQVRRHYLYREPTDISPLVPEWLIRNYYRKVVCEYSLYIDSVPAEYVPGLGQTLAYHDDSNRESNYRRAISYGYGHALGVSKRPDVRAELLSVLPAVVKECPSIVFDVKPEEVTPEVATTLIETYYELEKGIRVFPACCQKRWESYPQQVPPTQNNEKLCSLVARYGLEKEFPQITCEVDV